MKTYLLNLLSFLTIVAIAGFTSCKKDKTLSNQVEITKALLKGEVAGVTVEIKDKDIILSKNDGATTVDNVTLILTLSGGATSSFDGTEVTNNEITVALISGDIKDLVVTAEDKITTTTYKVKVKLITVQSLVAFWNFEGDSPLEDKTGNGHNGSIVRMVNHTTDRYGNTNAAYEFVGNPEGNNKAAGYIELINSNTLTSTTSLTMNYWINVKAFIADGEYYIISNNSWEGYKNSLPAHGNLVSTFSYGTVEERTSGSDYDADQPGTLEVGKWFMITVVYEQSTGMQKIYYNGKLAGEKEMTVGQALRTFSSNSTFVLGTEKSKEEWVELEEKLGYTEEDPYKSTFNGKLDDLRIYNEALTTAQILTLYSQEKP